MRSTRGSAAAAVLLLGAAAVQEGPPETLPDTLPAALPDEVPLGLPSELSGARPAEAAAALGRRLFFDPVLSVDGSVACASCHDPGHGFADEQPLSVGVNGHSTRRNAPTLYNRALGEAFMWDGRASTLEEQVLLPIADELEMGLPVAEAVERLARDASYTAAFRDAFGEVPTRAGLANALAAFVRRLLYGDSRVDRFRDGDHGALTPQERGGMWFFESRGACWRCHVGSNFTDEDFHNTGIGSRDGEPLEGRFAVTGDERDRGRFKTPTLRGLAETAPYMHDGSLATLEEVVEFYRKGGHANGNLDPMIGALEMSDEDAANLVAFLKALSRP